MVPTADNTPITAGSGTSIATDDVSSVFYQRVKIAVGADGVFKADKGVFGTTTAMTWNASLQSLAASSTVGQVCTEVDFSAETAGDVNVTCYVTMTTAGSPTGLVTFYLLTSVDGTLYSGDVSTYTGTNGSYTLGAANTPNAIPAAVIKPHANTAKYTQTFSMRQVFGTVPPFWALVCINDSGIALHSSGNGSDYRVIY